MSDDLISRQAAIDAVNSLTYPSSLVDVKWKLVDLPSAQRWIPVSERLPEYGERVLVTFRSKYIDRTTISVSRCYMQKEGFFSDQPFEYSAVAWMSLPEPYKEGNDE